MRTVRVVALVHGLPARGGETVLAVEQTRLTPGNLAILPRQYSPPTGSSLRVELPVKKEQGGLTLTTPEPPPHRMVPTG